MICPVCSKSFETGSECPRCEFPVIYTTDDDVSVLIVRHAKLIKEFRDRFLETVKVEVINFCWEANGDNLAEKSRTFSSLGTGTELYDNTVFGETKFARIPDVDSVDIFLNIPAGKETIQDTISIPNINSPELQQLGITLHKNLSCELILKTESGIESHSDISYPFRK